MCGYVCMYIYIYIYMCLRIGIHIHALHYAHGMRVGRNTMLNMLQDLRIESLCMCSPRGCAKDLVDSTRLSPASNILSDAVYMYTYMYVCMYVCVHVYIYIYICIEMSISI